MSLQVIRNRVAGRKAGAGSWTSLPVTEGQEASPSSASGPTPSPAPGLAMKLKGGDVWESIWNCQEYVHVQEPGLSPSERRWGQQKTHTTPVSHREHANARSCHLTWECKTLCHHCPFYSFRSWKRNPSCLPVPKMQFPTTLLASPEWGLWNLQTSLGEYAQFQPS